MFMLNLGQTVLAHTVAYPVAANHRVVGAFLGLGLVVCWLIMTLTGWGLTATMSAGTVEGVWGSLAGSGQGGLGTAVLRPCHAEGPSIISFAMMGHAWKLAWTGGWAGLVVGLGQGIYIMYCGVAFSGYASCGSMMGAQAAQVILGLAELCTWAGWRESIVGGLGDGDGWSMIRLAQFHWLMAVLSWVVVIVHLACAHNGSAQVVGVAMGWLGAVFLVEVIAVLIAATGAAIDVLEYVHGALVGWSFVEGRLPPASTPEWMFLSPYGALRGACDPVAGVMAAIMSVWGAAVVEGGSGVPFMVPLVFLIFTVGGGSNVSMVANGVLVGLLILVA